MINDVVQKSTKQQKDEMQKMLSSINDKLYETIKNINDKTNLDLEVDIKTIKDLIKSDS